MQYWILRKFIIHRLTPIIWRNEQITPIPSPNFIQFNSLHFPCFWHRIQIRMTDFYPFGVSQPERSCDDEQYDQCS